MPMPSTAAEVETALAEFRRSVDISYTIMREWQRDMLDRIFPPPAPPRQRTGDMVQMLDDLGIEPPKRHPKDWRDLTFVWRN